MYREVYSREVHSPREVFHREEREGVDITVFLLFR